MTTSNNQNEQATPAFPMFDPIAHLVSYCKNKAELEASKKSINYVTSADGQVYEIRKTALGEFCVKAKNVQGADMIQEGMKWKLPKKIPFKMFLEIVTFFRDVADEFAEDEAMIQIWWDTKTEEFFSVCLKQTTTKVSVRYLRDKDLELDDSKICVMDIHSHNTMDAFWSGTDDANEKETRVYGVIGKIKQAVPAYKFRYSVAGDFRALNIFDVIEPPVMKLSWGEGVEETLVPISESNIQMPRVDFPDEWLEIVREGKAASRANSPYYNTVKDHRPGSYTKPEGYRYGSGFTPAGQTHAPTGRRNPIGQMSFWREEEPSIRQTHGQHGGVPFDPDEEAHWAYQEERHYDGLDEEHLPMFSSPDDLLAIVSEMEPDDINAFIEELISYGHEDAVLEKLRQMGYQIATR